MSLWTTHIRLALAGLVSDLPGWSLRYDSAARLWLATAPTDGGAVTYSAADPDALRSLVRRAQSQTLVIP